MIPRKLVWTALLTTGLVNLMLPLFLLSGAPQFSETQPAMVRLDELNVAARIREFADGRFLPTEISLHEHKDLPGIREILPIWIGGWLARMSGSVACPFVLMDLVMPFLTIFIFYFFLRELKIRPNWLLPGSLILFFFYDPDALAFLSSWAAISPHIPLIEMERFPSPQFNFPLLILALFCHLRFAHTAQKRLIVLGILLQSGIVYSYFYFAVFLVTWNLGMAGYYLLCRDRRMLKYILWTGLGTLILGSPYLAMILRLSAQVPMEDILERFGIYHGRFIYKFLTLKYVGLFLAALLFFRPITQERWIMALALGAGILLLNKQFFTGSNLHPMHWHLRILHPFSIVLILQIGSACVDRFLTHYPTGVRWLQRAVVIFSLLVVGSTAFKMVYSAINFKNFDSNDVFSGVVDFINSKWPSGTVVLSLDGPLMRQLLIRTSIDLYLPHFSGTLATQDEINKRLAGAVYWLEFDCPTFLNYLISKEGQPLLKFISGNYFYFERYRTRQETFHWNRQEVQEMSTRPGLRIPPEYLTVCEENMRYFESTPPQPTKDSYALDLLIINKIDWGFSSPDVRNGSSVWSLIYEDSTYQIYQRHSAGL